MADVSTGAAENVRAGTRGGDVATAIAGRYRHPPGAAVVSRTPSSHETKCASKPGIPSTYAQDAFTWRPPTFAVNDIG
ncbi:hypothetical protein ACX5I6_16185 [Arthrobacter sp. MMS24-T111]